MESLPNTWNDIHADIIYVVPLVSDDLQVSFSEEQIKLGIRYDQKGKHLK